MRICALLVCSLVFAAPAAATDASEVELFVEPEPIVVEFGDLFDLAESSSPALLDACEFCDDQAEDDDAPVALEAPRRRIPLRSRHIRWS